MARIRSPGYPSIDLSEAIEMVGKIHSANRTNVIDREAAVRDMGYSGVTGASGKMLANLLHYGLLEKAGKGSIRVSDIAVDILHPEQPQLKLEALKAAAFSPELFDQLHEKFPEGPPSENAIRSYLMRSGFSEVAIGPAVRSFLETYLLIQQEGVYESKGGGRAPPVESRGTEHNEGAITMISKKPEPQADSSITRALNVQTSPHTGERTVFVEEGATGQYLRLQASGEITDYLLEALEDYVRRQRKRLSKSDPGTSEESGPG